METAQELLTAGLTSLSIAPERRIVDSFVRYLSELKKWNRAYNLTALESDKDIIVKHFLDSLLYLVYIEGKKSVCDVGSGAGFPGVPLAIVRPELAVTLVEPSRKKCAFLKHLRRALGIASLEVVESRVEEVRGRSFDIVATRALFSINELIRKGRHLVAREGFFLFSKGPKLDDELRELPPEAQCEIKRIALPLSQLSRSLVKVALPQHYIQS